MSTVKFGSGVGLGAWVVTFWHYSDLLILIIIGYFFALFWALATLASNCTSRTATPEIAADAHRVIRAEAAKAIGEQLAHNLRILYGGSVKPDNAKSLMSQEEIDGALVGGASLDPKSFAAIAHYLRHPVVCKGLSSGPEIRPILEPPWPDGSPDRTLA
jgi:hypothetical protein